MAGSAASCEGKKGQAGAMLGLEGGVAERGRSRGGPVGPEPEASVMELLGFSAGTAETEALARGCSSTAATGGRAAARLTLVGRYCERCAVPAQPAPDLGFAG